MPELDVCRRVKNNQSQLCVNSRKRTDAVRERAAADRREESLSEQL